MQLSVAGCSRFTAKLIISDFVPVESEAELLSEFASYEYNPDKTQNFYGGIVFGPDFDYDSEGKIPDLDYKIRFGNEHTSTETKYIFPMIQLSGPGNSGNKIIRLLVQFKLNFLTWK